jgi:hypothetical protein
MYLEIRMLFVLHGTFKVEPVIPSWPVLETLPSSMFDLQLGKFSHLKGETFCGL